MTQAFTPIPQPEASQVMSLEAFLAWDDGSEQLYELIGGEPMPMSDPTAAHEDVADDLCDLLKAHCTRHTLPFVLKRSKLISVGSHMGSHNGKDSARRADILVFDQAEWERMKGLSSSAMAYQAPPLVIEVVSTNWRDDYLTKLAEYEAIGVREYWIVDYAGRGGIRYIGRPKQPTLLIYAMEEAETEYGEPRIFRGDEGVVSQVFETLSVTADEVLGKTA